MADFGSSEPPPSSRDVAGEDFLFHLYRGSELLQDNRVHEAKTELEHALALQPSDPKGQDLLAIVYFRLGMYPRAIAIYERLVQLHPTALEPRINLALSYLKTGQPAQARSELEKVLEQNPSHSRAWGYLGLAFKALGDFERASHAFAAGGHDQMARRLVDMAVASGSMSIRPETASLRPATAELRKIGSDAFHEIERVDAALRADADLHRPIPGTWSSADTGYHRVTTISRETAAARGGGADRAPGSTSGGAADGERTPNEPPGITEALRPASLPAFPTVAPARAGDFARDKMLVFPRDLAVAQHTTGLVLVQASNGFATRLEIVRSMAYSSGWTCEAMMRRSRGRQLDEPLGGASSPIFQIAGKGELVLGATGGQQLQPLSIETEPVYLREESVGAFDASVTYENGRLALGDGEALAMLQLRGPGSVVAQLPERVSSVELRDGRSLVVRALTVLGWVGRLVPRPMLPSEAPAGVRGFVALAGEGIVLLDAR